MGQTERERDGLREGDVGADRERERWMGIKTKDSWHISEEGKHKQQSIKTVITIELDVCTEGIKERRKLVREDGLSEGEHL